MRLAREQELRQQRLGQWQERCHCIALSGSCKWLEMSLHCIQLLLMQVAGEFVALHSVSRAIGSHCIASAWVTAAAADGDGGMVEVVACTNVRI